MSAEQHFNDTSYNSWGQYGIGLSPFKMDGSISIGTATLTTIDVVLVVFCPVAAALGMIVALVLKQDIFEKSLSVINRTMKSIGYIFSGLVLGLVIALFFIGSITPELTSLARILALSILLGYQAPAIWFSQEKVISKLIDKKVRELVNTKEKDG